MSERTAQQLVDRLNSSDPDFDDCTDAAIILLRQHAEIERLTSINTALTAKSNSYVIENAWLTEKIDRLTAEKFRRFNGEECWIYQRNGDNHLDTLKCPVVISPEDLLSMQAEISALTAERDAHAAEIDRLKRERHHIYDLLARIHRDGGQYTAEHGVEKACDDAEAQVVAWLETINGIDALIEQARIAERGAISAKLRELADELGYGSSWWGPPGGLLLRAAEMVSARSAT
ncbi:MAG: hypothetical protein ABTS22_19980 [Accumulibacter sp.]|uniref:hypothetical protein n=1 Tax=Accumulibacter sp. TaxID=2053492 RepID=UPI003315C83D